MDKKLVIETAENGYVVQCWDDNEDSTDQYGYQEPTKHVATDVDGVIALVKDLLKE